MRLSSPSFNHGAAIPQEFTCEGKDISPELSWTDAPKETVSFAVLLHDPDAPRAGGFAHWIVYNIPKNVNRIEENVPSTASVPALGIQGTNDFGNIGYGGPCPPSGNHRYFATLYALNAHLDLGPGAKYKDVVSAMEGKIIAEAVLLGTYAKTGRKAA
jgi:Raf kinase inhibitor-like YbhB/YbcL family protein